MTCIFTENVALPQAIFKHFASKNQLSGLSVNGTLVENGLKYIFFLLLWDLQKKLCSLPNTIISTHM